MALPDLARGFATAPGGDHSGAAVLRRLAQSLAVLLALLAVDVTAAMAGDTIAQATPDTAPSDPDAWRFRVALYGRAPSVAGSLTARGQTVDVNASFIQIVQKSEFSDRLHGRISRPTRERSASTWTRCG